jgi:hypothetical protein
MQEVMDSIRRLNLRITGISEEEVQVKGINNIFNNIITEYFPNLEKVMPIHVQEASSRTSHQHIIIKTTSTENRERILKAIREKKIK